MTFHLSKHTYEKVTWKVTCMFIESSHAKFSSVFIISSSTRFCCFYKHVCVSSRLNLYDSLAKSSLYQNVHGILMLYLHVRLGVFIGPSSIIVLKFSCKIVSCDKDVSRNCESAVTTVICRGLICSL